MSNGIPKSGPFIPAALVIGTSPAAQASVNDGRRDNQSSMSVTQKDTRGARHRTMQAGKLQAELEKNFLNAVQTGNLPIIEKLGKSLTLLYTQNENGRNALMIAAGAGQIKSVETLMQTPGADTLVNMQHPQTGETALHMAVEQGDLATVMSLLKKANPDIQRSDGATALHLSAVNGYLAIALALLGEHKPKQ